MRQTQASSRLPSAVNISRGPTRAKVSSLPAHVISLFSADGPGRASSLSNYAYINLNDALTRSEGFQRSYFVAGEIACD